MTLMEIIRSTFGLDVHQSPSRHDYRTDKLKCAAERNTRVHEERRRRLRESRLMEALDEATELIKGGHHNGTDH